MFHKPESSRVVLCVASVVFCFSESAGCTLRSGRTWRQIGRDRLGEGVPPVLPRARLDGMDLFISSSTSVDGVSAPKHDPFGVGQTGLRFAGASLLACWVFDDSTVFLLHGRAASSGCCCALELPAGGCCFSHLRADWAVQPRS